MIPSDPRQPPYPGLPSDLGFPPGFSHLFTTCVGSHMWCMSLTESDVDLAHIYSVPARFLLEGRPYPRTLGQKKSLRLGLEYDELFWEVGHLVDQLIRANINALWITMSPLVVKDGPDLWELRRIAQSNLSKGTYRSIRGVAESHLREAKRRPDTAAKSLSTALRTIHFGLGLLSEGRLDFKPVVEEVSVQKVLEALKHLDISYQRSSLPERPDEEPFRRYLYQLRLRELYR